MPFDLSEATQVLERTPGVLQAMLSELPDGWIRANEGPQTWSPFDIVGHLIHGEKTDWIPRAKIILGRGNNVMFEPFDRFAQLEDSQQKTMSDLLLEFENLRQQNLQSLRDFAITPEQCEWTGQHPEFGAVTLAELLATWATHDLGHIGQVARVMAKRYTTEVGPWRKYLRVLSS